MRTLIVGAGTVGYYLAMQLVREKHEVVVVDQSAERLAHIEDHLDAQTLEGDGCDPAVLSKVLGDGEVKLALAVTNEDAVNLVVGYTAKRLGAERVGARVRSRYFLKRGGPVAYREPLGIDFLLSPEGMTAEELARFIDNPAALGIAAFADNKVHLRTVMLSPFSELADHTIPEVAAKLPPGVLVAAVQRGKKVFVPRGDSRLEGGDKVTLLGLPDSVSRVHALFDTEQDTSKAKALRVAIAGAGETGLHLAERLEDRGHRVYLIDKDRRRCEVADERLRDAVVLHGDCTNIQFLKEESIGRMDYFVGATGDDESNIMSALLAKELKVPKAATLIDRPDYVRVIEKVGIDVALSPRIVAANRVLAQLERESIQSLFLLAEGAVEVREYKAAAHSPIVGEKLMDIKPPKGTLVGAIVHGDEVVIPRGGDSVRPGDRVIAVAEEAAVDEMGAMFRAPEGRG